MPEVVKVTTRTQTTKHRDEPGRQLHTYTYAKGGGREGLLYAIRVTTNSNAQCTTRGAEVETGVCWSGRSWYRELLLGTTFLVTATHAKNRGCRGSTNAVSAFRLDSIILFLEECCTCRVVG